MHALLPIIIGCFSAVLIPLLAMNWLAGLIGGTWLVILGKWTLVLIGFAFIIFDSIAASILLAPAIFLTALGTQAFKRGSIYHGGLLIVLGSFWTYAIIVTWQIVIFIFFLSQADSRDQILPIFLWSWGAANGVWSYFAYREKQSSNNHTSTWTAGATQLSFLIFSICQLLLNISLKNSILLMLIPIVLILVLGVYTVIVELRRETEALYIATDDPKEVIDKPLHTQTFHQTDDPDELALIKKYELAMQEKRARQAKMPPS